jgi:hypothetical protein
VDDNVAASAEGTVDPAQQGQVSSNESIATKQREEIRRQIVERWAEGTATAVGGIVGGTSIILFGIQPISATGAILQEMLHWVPGAPNTYAIPGIFLLRLLIMLICLIIGTQVGRYTCANCRKTTARQRTAAVILAGVVAILLLFGGYWIYEARALFPSGSFNADHKTEFAGSVWTHTKIVSAIAVAVGLMWGCMPDDAQTTAKSAQLKRLALYRPQSLLFVGMFGLLAALTIGFLSTFLNPQSLQYSRTAAFDVLVLIYLGGAASAFASVVLYVLVWTDERRKAAPIDGTAVFVGSFVGLLGVAGVFLYLLNLNLEELLER